MTLAERAEVIFVGGTEFSGADVVARAIGARPDVAAVPLPARFHSDPWGIPALLHGRIGADDFVARLRAHDVARRVAPQVLESALETFGETYHADPLAACRELFWALLSGIVDAGGAGVVVESSPGNLVEAHALARLVPGARFVHVARDGRDVAAAVREADSGPGRMTEALAWWADRLREIERGVRGEEDGAPYAIGDERFVTVVLDELASSGRDAAYEGLFDRLSLDAGGSAPTGPAAGLDAAAIGRGRWRAHARGPGAWLLARRYARMLSELAEEGNHAAAPLIEAYGRLP